MDTTELLDSLGSLYTKVDTLIHELRVTTADLDTERETSRKLRIAWSDAESELDAMRNLLREDSIDEDSTAHMLLSTTDAMVWAAEFERIKNKMGWTLDDIDEGLMIGWFANAFAAQEFKK